jgi:hypothetical protein
VIVFSIEYATLERGRDPDAEPDAATAGATQIARFGHERDRPVRETPFYV